MKSYGILFRWLFQPVIFFLAILFIGCKGKTKSYEPTYSINDPKKKTLLYAVPTQAYFEMHAAFVNYLNEYLTDTHIQISASSEFSAYSDKINKGLFDMAIGHGLMALDSNRLGYSFLGESVGEEPNAGAILVHKDSLIRNFADLKNRSIATPGSPAIPGHMLQMVYLSKKGLDVKKEIILKEVESFESVILNIYLGKCSAGFTSMNGWRGFLKKRPETTTRVALKWVTASAPGNTILVGKHVNKKTVKQLENLIINMHMNKAGRQALSDLGYRKFIPADTNTFLPLKKFLKEYNNLVADPEQ